ncbi:DUF4143 domain-containing protein [Bifidobacterium avesanii]
MTVFYGPRRDLLLSDSNRHGHLVESAVGAYLLRRSVIDGFSVNWWRGRNNREVDSVIGSGASCMAMEVKADGFADLATPMPWLSASTRHRGRIFLLGGVLLLFWGFGFF